MNPRLLVNMSDSWQIDANLSEIVYFVNFLPRVKVILVLDAGQNPTRETADEVARSGARCTISRLQF